MSTPQDSALQRNYPLSPPDPHSELRKSAFPSQSLSDGSSFAGPGTPQSPVKGAPSSDTMNDVAIRGGAGTITTSPPSMDMDMNGMNGGIDDGALKRKFEGPEIGEHKDKKLHVEERKPSISDLHIDVGKIYQLCRTPHPPAQPDLTMDLFSLYGLNSIAAKVARTHPDGTKNGLRKTYKGHIKSLGINGKFDVKLHDEDNQPSGLMTMMREPDLEWNVSQVHGRPMTLPSLGIIQKGVQMNKGIVPKQMWDCGVLGELDMKKEGSGGGPQPPSFKGLGAGGTQRASSYQSSGYRPPQPKDLEARPKRAVKKRGYDESSFEGYGEGFVDDDMADGGYSTGDGEDGRKRRKKSSALSSQYRNERYTSYGPGGVGS